MCNVDTYTIRDDRLFRFTTQGRTGRSYETQFTSVQPLSCEVVTFRLRSPSQTYHIEYKLHNHWRCIRPSPCHRIYRKVSVIHTDPAQVKSAIKMTLPFPLWYDLCRFKCNLIQSTWKWKLLIHLFYMRHYETNFLSNGCCHKIHYKFLMVFECVFPIDPFVWKMHDEMVSSGTFEMQFPAQIKVSFSLRIRFKAQQTPVQLVDAVVDVRRNWWF